MDILMFETCWANIKCNKYHKWHQVGFYSLNYYNDARSIKHSTAIFCLYWGFCPSTRR